MIEKLAGIQGLGVQSGWGPEAAPGALSEILDLAARRAVLLMIQVLHDVIYNIVL